jgi:hypothetical protein
VEIHIDARFHPYNNENQLISKHEKSKHWQKNGLSQNTGSSGENSWRIKRTNTLNSVKQRGICIGTNNDK